MLEQVIEYLAANEAVYDEIDMGDQAGHCRLLAEAAQAAIARIAALHAELAQARAERDRAIAARDRGEFLAACATAEYLPSDSRGISSIAWMARQVDWGSDPWAEGLAAVRRITRGEANSPC